MKRTLVFDVDDTLLATVWTYDVAYASFLEFLYKTLPGRAPAQHDVYERLFEIEAELSKSWGVKRGRVAESMAMLYCEVCDWIKERHGEDLYRIEDQVKIRKIGDGPFDYTKHFWLPKVKETLRILVDRGYRLCLLTSYDTQLFIERAEFVGLNKFFNWSDIRFIESKKTSADFIEVSGWQPDASGSWFAIGNGESDIRPAIDIAENWHGIYIPHRTTSPFFKRDGKRVNFDAAPIEHPRVINIRTFSEILNHI